jgi:hypothetical protein
MPYTIVELKAADSPKAISLLSGELISANVTGGVLALYNGTSISDPKMASITSTGSTVETHQSFFFTGLYATLTAGVAYLKYR